VPQWLWVSAGLADHSGGPAPDSHRFPIFTASPRGARRTCRDGDDDTPAGGRVQVSWD